MFLVKHQDSSRLIIKKKLIANHIYIKKIGVLSIISTRKVRRPFIQKTRVYVPPLILVFPFLAVGLQDPYFGINLYGYLYEGNSNNNKIELQPS